METEFQCKYWTWEKFYPMQFKEESESATFKDSIPMFVDVRTGQAAMKN